MPMSFNAQLLSQLIKQVGNQETTNSDLNNALRLLSKWRSLLIQNTVIQYHGTTVLQGPLVDMDFFRESAEGCHTAKLLGTYEQSLQPYIEEAIANAFTTILNIGCAEGYYAVGMALRMPNAKVFAFDVNENAQEVCALLAAKNNISERVTVGALFKPEDFSNYENQNVLVFCDVEGSELEILNTEIAPSLLSMDIIVESHECLVPGVTDALIKRFIATHEIIIVQDNGQRSIITTPEWFNRLAHLDQLIATWEWRSGATPWLVMKSKNRSFYHSK